MINDITLHLMKAKNYEEINTLPKNAKTVKRYAQEVGFAHAYIYVKYERAKDKGIKIDYEIKKFQGINFVIPN